MKIDLKWLSEKSACAAGVEWFKKHFPQGGEYQEILTALAADGHMDYASWLLFAGRLTAGLTLRPMVEAAVKYVFDRADWTKKESSATGDQGAASATGDQGAASATGYQGAASAEGVEGCAVALGYESKVKGVKGAWLTVSEWTYDEKKDEIHRIDVQTVRVDGKKIKADTYYMLKGGKWVVAS